MTFNLTLFVKLNVCTSREFKAKPNWQTPAYTIRIEGDFSNQLIPPMKLFFFRVPENRTSHMCMENSLLEFSFAFSQFQRYSWFFSVSISDESKPGKTAISNFVKMSGYEISYANSFISILRLLTFNNEKGRIFLNLIKILIKNWNRNCLIVFTDLLLLGKIPKIIDCHSKQLVDTVSEGRRSTKFHTVKWW